MYALDVVSGFQFLVDALGRKLRKSAHDRSTAPPRRVVLLVMAFSEEDCRRVARLPVVQEADSPGRGLWLWRETGKMCDDTSGIRLTKGDPILLEIAHLFSDVKHVTALAVYLGVGDSDGASFVEGLTAPGARPDAASIAFAVLRKWCDEKPEELYGGKLFNVLNLKLVNPGIAVQFKPRLIPPSYPDKIGGVPPVAGEELSKNGLCMLARCQMIAMKFSVPCMCFDMALAGSIITVKSQLAFSLTRICACVSISCVNLRQKARSRFHKVRAFGAPLAWLSQAFLSPKSFSGFTANQKIAIIADISRTTVL